jgi:PAS domain S-box-containing protein
MTARALFSSIRPLLSSPRAIAWLGGLFIGAIAVMAAYDIVRGYHVAVENTGRELDTQARTFAEQTARSIQAVDIVLRHLDKQARAGTFAAMSAQDLHLYLREQAVGLVQTDGIAVRNASGVTLAASWVHPVPPGVADVSDRIFFQELREKSDGGLYIGGALKSRMARGEWVFPIARRLESPLGEFAGFVAARGRVDYFQEFYRDAQPDAGTVVTLMHRDGVLIARHPPIPAALGKSFPSFREMMATHAASRPQPTRRVSPADGVEYFGAIAYVPDYPLAIIVGRDTAIALAPWRAQALGSILRTAALAAFAALLLAMALRQVSRLNAARRSLEISQERFAVAVAGSDDGIFEWDYATGRAFGSQRAREILGLPPGPETQSIEEWFAGIERQFHPDDVARRLAAIEAHLDGRTPAYEGEFRVRNPDSSYRWVRIRGLCVRRGTERPHRMAGSISDIDARKRAEEGLRKSEERFALAVAGSNDGIVDWDVVNDRMYSSERAMQILGIESGVTVRTRAQWRALVKYHPDDEPRMKEELQSFLDGHTELRDGEYRVLLPGGNYRWIRHRNKCVRDSSGRPLRVAGSVSDIDRQKRAEAERLNLQGQLLQAKKLEAIGTLAGGIAHDFNNILAAILGYGEMAQKSAPQGTPLRRHVDAVVSAGLRAKSLVERILAFSRSGMGERVPVNVQSVVGEALDLVAASLPSHVKLECRLTAEDAAVMGDPTQIHQVVMNLCANAAQAMKSQGTLAVALVVVERGGAAAATSTLSAGRYVRLSVSDTGTGMSPDVIERIFDPFFTTKEVGVGTGLGLSLVHGIVTDLGGGIDVESVPGNGTTFTVYLPWSNAVAAPAAAPEPVPQGAGETILLVDDEESLVRLGEELIAALGYEPVGFTSADAALEAFRVEPQRFDAVLTDETMPGLTGADLAREIHAIRRETPIVLMSGFVNTALTLRARDAGVAAVLSKPLAADEIGRVLATALRDRATTADSDMRAA